MITSRDINDLLPAVREIAEAFRDGCAEVGITIIFTATYRDHESQAALYAIGRTVSGKKVTNAGPGDSFHNWRCAWDFVPIVNGKAVWDDDALWQRCGAIAHAVGAEWGGSWQSFKDKPHCQYTGGLTLDQLKAGAHP